MKILKKILIITAILFCSSNNFSSANSDCWAFVWRTYNQWWQWANWFDIVKISRETTSWFASFLTVDQQKAIITNDDLNTALLNLKKYCCEHDESMIWSQSCEKDYWFFNENALDSPYLFDHLLDVILRRLNGLPGEKNIYTKTKMTLDDKWKDWRERINKEALNTKWSNPQTISTKYTEFWKQSPSNLGYNITSQIYATFWALDDQRFLKYVSGEWSPTEATDSKIIAEAFKNYDKRTLYDRYINACALSKYFYALLDVWPNSDDKKIIINKTADNSCDKIIENQIKWENQYVSLVAQRSSNLFLSNYIEWYISYLYERQDRLQKLRKDVTDRRLDVVRAIPCLESYCQRDR